MTYQNKSEYDRGVNTFSPEGRIFQIEYAIEAIKLGSTSVGIQTRDGVILAAEKRLPSTLIEPSSVNKIFEIDHHMGAVLSGMAADARILIEHARVEAQNHRFTYDEPMPVESCTLSTCDLSIRFGEGGKKKMLSRPFGVSLLIAGVDDKGAQLWLTDPSGTYTRYEAKAIGAGADAAQAILVEHYHRSMTLAEGQTLALSILKQVMEDKITNVNVDVMVIEVDPSKKRKIRTLKPEEIQPMLDSLPEQPGSA
jgi:20S proteasome subunit alpha 5